MDQRWAIVSGDFVLTGGMDVANHALALHLAERAARVHLVAHRVAPEITSRPGVRFYGVPRPLGAHLAGAPLLDGVGRLVGRRVLAKGGRVVVNGGNCGARDVCWVHYVHAAYAPQVATGALRRAKETLSRARALDAERRVIGRASTVIVNSDVTRRHVVDLLGVGEDRVFTVYYGIDPARFGPTTREERESSRRALGLGADEPAIAFVGALGDRRKGFDTLFEAVRILDQEGGWDGRLVVVGAGAELSAWRQRAADADLAGRIAFLGFRGDVPAILAGCDALAAPTRYEAYGLGVHEALCRGIPALVSASAGVAERYPASLSELRVLEYQSPEAWAAALRRWRSDIAGFSERVAPFAEALRARSWDDMARDIVSLVASRPPPL